MTLMLTPEAAETIRQLADQPGVEGMRISGADESVNGDGPGLQIAIVPGPEPEDRVIEAEGALLYLDSAADRTMDDKILHAAIDSGQVRFELFEQADGNGADPS
jgi:Fe-S cluster assembly iron-binding protein IscA